MATGLALAIAVAALAPPREASAARPEIDREVTAALKALYREEPSARTLAKKAYAVLVFPSILKAGFMFGGQIGNGALRKGDRTLGYYNSVAASYGFQAGIQRFGYALFFMDAEAVENLNATAGFELGVGPSLVVLDQGMAKTITTETLTSDVYAIVFGQQGLMAGAGVQGSKITRLPD
jgi:lipid-binding SYLF domain-containing protein